MSQDSQARKAFPFVRERNGLYRLKHGAGGDAPGASIRFDSLGEASGEARYSYQAIAPYREIVVRGDRIETREHRAERTTTRIARGNPWDSFETIARLGQGAVRVPDAGRGAGDRGPGDRGAGDLVALPPLPEIAGYWGYGLTPFAIPVESVQADPMGLPDAHVAFYDAILVRDRVENRTLLVSTGLPGRDPDARAERAARRLRELESQIEPEPSIRPAVTNRRAGAGGSHAVPPQWTPAAPPAYFRAIDTILDHIREGDIYQANHTELFRVRSELSPREHYDSLREANPANYAALFDARDYAVLSSSPELLLRLDGREAVSAPIKGTRPRGGDSASDARLAEELRASDKDLAEHTMIVDLVRNDLGIGCVAGTVRVDPFLAIESHPTVHHLVSYVRGTVPAGRTWAAVLRDLFPGGSVTGAPKRRAVQIIDAIEETGRGAFYGCLGFVGQDGRGAWNLLIRSAVWKPGELAFRVGGGIVADSTPQGEWEELAWKGSALHRAFTRPGGGDVVVLPATPAKTGVS